MAYKALYRTYRPTTFDEVAGQQHIITTLKNAIANNKIAHAYLFAGPRGTGKTTMAKLFAKALNCEEGLGHQCNKCKNCIAIGDGSHPDVIEIDAASNNGVEEVRDLIEKVKYGTILGKKKVYIIDEVHMMTPAAFNALLKTLEEPPEHVIFILATTEPHKILPTILSRCQRFDFTKVSAEDTKVRIKVILEKEKVSYNEEAVNLIISLADGGMRDALSLLDQVLAYSSNKLVEEDILNIFALESKEEKINLLNSISYGNTSDVLNRLQTYISKGSDIKRLTNDLLLIMKDTLIYKTSNNASYFEILNKDDASFLEKRFDKSSLNKIIDTLLNTLKDYKNVSSINPLFEITLLKLCSFFSGDDNEEKPVEIEKKTAKTPQIEKTIIKQEEKLEPIIEEKIDLIQSKVEEEKIEEKPIDLTGLIVPKSSTNDDHYFINDELMLNIMVTSKKDIKNDLLDKWSNLKRFIPHPTLGRAASLLADAHPLVASNKIIVVEFQLPKSAEMLNRLDRQKDLQDLIYSAFNKKMFVYALSRNESIKHQRTYMNLLQINKLPKANDVLIEFEGE